MTNPMRSEIWNIGESPAYEDKTSVKYEFRTYYDRNNVETPGLRDYTFEVNEPDSFIKPSSGFLVGSIQVFKAGVPDVNLAEGDVIALCQNFACSFFQKAEYTINDQLIESQDYVHMKTHLKGLIEFSTDYTFSHTTDQVWFPDTGNGVDSSTEINVAGGVGTSNADFNSGFKKRVALIAGSRVVFFRVPIARLFDIHKHINHVWKGARHTVRLLRQSSDNQLLHSSAGDDGKIKLKSLNLWLPICVPELTKLREIEDTLSKAGPMSISYPLSQAYRSQKFTEGSPRWNVATLTERPTALYIFCQYAARVTTSDQLWSRFIFDNLHLTRARVTLGSHTFPEHELRTQFNPADPKGEDYIRAFHDLLAISQPMGDLSSGGLINLTSYRTLYPIIAVDLSAQAESLFAAGSVAELTIELDVSPPVPLDPDGDPAPADYHIWAVVDSSRKLNYNIVDKRVLVSRA